MFGLFSDGQDPMRSSLQPRPRGHAVAPVLEKGSASVVYRFADTLMPPGEATGGVATLDSPPAARADRCPADLRRPWRRAAGAGGDAADQAVIQVAVVGDVEFSGFIAPSGGLTPEAAIAARMNIVDGIYSSQVGVKVVVTDVTLFRAEPDLFTSTTVLSTAAGPSSATGGAASRLQTSRALTHLLTGRDLDGSTVGIAHLGALCSGLWRRLTQGTLSEANSRW